MAKDDSRMGDTLASEALEGARPLADWEGSSRGCSSAGEVESGAEDDEDRDAELLSAAASAIQSAWTACRTRRGKEPRVAPSSSAGPTEQVLTVRLQDCERRNQSCCISCFQLMPARPATPTKDQPYTEGTSHAEPELLCAACISRLGSRQRPHAGSNAGASASSALPKLSLLVQAEAKCQDQLQLLRSQQELLRQRREELQATKRAKAQQLAAEKELARQRRRHFIQVQERRRREEELKFQQFQADDHTSRSEQEAAGAQTNKPKKPKQKRKTMAASDNPPQRRKTVELTDSGARSLSLPHLVDSTPRMASLRHPSLGSDSDANVASAAAEARTKSLWERRRQTLACYSQDLSPLIDGLKPKRMPFPKSTSSTNSGSSSKRRLTLGNASNHTAKPRKTAKLPAPKSVKLQPLEDQHQSHTRQPQQVRPSNQYDERSDRIQYEPPRKDVAAAPLSLQVPKRTLNDHSAPLTAEIKPVSWAYELTKDVGPHVEAHNALEATATAFPAPLPSVAEETRPDPFSLFQLKHQLPSPTPCATLPTAASKFSTTPTQPSETVAPRWEYSSARLTSLLQKYNVSVSAITGPRKV